MSFLRKPDAAAAAAASTGLPDGGDFQANYPAVWEYLALARYDDGSARDLATLLVFTEGGQFKVCLSDKATDMVLWCTGDCFYAVMEGMDKALQGGTAQWRKKAPQKARGSK